MVGKRGITVQLIHKLHQQNLTEIPKKVFTWLF
jgi:hypothetical protein